MRVTSLLLSAFLMLFVVLPEASGKPPGGHLNITQVFVSNPDSSTSFMIIGEDLLFGPNPPSVTLGDLGPLTIVGTPTNTLIEASYPAVIPDGDYLMTVFTGTGQSQDDEYDLTIGAIGPQGIQGPQGDVGPQGLTGETGSRGYQGEIGPQGAQGDIGPKGDQGLQGGIGPQGFPGGLGPQGIPGPDGPQGPQGDQGPQGGQGEGINLRIATFIETANEECSYGGTVYFGLSRTCEPRLQVGANGEHTGSCVLEPSAVAGEDGNSCFIPDVAAACPFGDAPQGQSQLIQCDVRPGDGGIADYIKHRCIVVEKAIGLPSVCADISPLFCSSSCTITNAVEECAFGICITVFPGACQPPLCSERAVCQTPVRTLTHATSALCMKVEPSTLL